MNFVHCQKDILHAQREAILRPKDRKIQCVRAVAPRLNVLSSGRGRTLPDCMAYDLLALYFVFRLSSTASIEHR